MKTLSLSAAKQHLGRVADESSKGHPVLILRKSRILILQKNQRMDPIPMRPEGYFLDCTTKKEAITSHRLASKSPKKIIS